MCASPAATVLRPRALRPLPGLPADFAPVASPTGNKLADILAAVASPTGAKFASPIASSATESLSEGYGAEFASPIASPIAAEFASPTGAEFASPIGQRESRPIALSEGYTPATPETLSVSVKSSPDRPSQCSGCNASFEADQPYFPWTEEGQFLCQVCAEANVPTNCSLCSEPFGPGHAVFRGTSARNKFVCERCAAIGMASNAAEVSAQRHICSSCESGIAFGHRIFRTEAGLVLCKNCWDAAPKDCGLCAKPVSGTVARFAGKVYHIECFKCAACSERIRGKCALGPAGLFCAPCKERITAQMLEIQDCLESGRAVRAAQVAESLRQKGIAVPGMPQLRCKVCARKLTGACETQCEQVINDLICLRCRDGPAASSKTSLSLTTGSQISVLSMTASEPISVATANQDCLPHSVQD